MQVNGANPPKKKCGKYKRTKRNIEKRARDEKGGLSRIETKII